MPEIWECIMLVYIPWPSQLCTGVGVHHEISGSCAIKQNFVLAVTTRMTSSGSSHSCYRMQLTLVPSQRTLNSPDILEKPSKNLGVITQ